MLSLRESRLLSYVVVVPKPDLGELREFVRNFSAALGAPKDMQAGSPAEEAAVAALYHSDGRMRGILNGFGKVAFRVVNHCAVQMQRVNMTPSNQGLPKGYTLWGPRGRPQQFCSHCGPVPSHFCVAQWEEHGGPVERQR